MTSASCRAFGFSSRCVDNEEEDWEHLGRSGKDVFGCGYTLVGAQCKDFMVTTRGKRSLVEVTKVRLQHVTNKQGT